MSNQAKQILAKAQKEDLAAQRRVTKLENVLPPKKGFFESLFGGSTTVPSTTTNQT